MQRAQGRIIAVAEEKLRKGDRVKMTSSEGITEPVFEEGSYVLVQHRRNSLRSGSKE